jgi:hypothetical protein
MHLPFGSIDGNMLVVRFSTADFSVATVIGGLREHMDMFEAMDVSFLGIATDVPKGMPSMNKPIDIQAHFEFSGEGEGKETLFKVYKSLWKRNNS